MSEANHVFEFELDGLFGEKVSRRCEPNAVPRPMGLGYEPGGFEGRVPRYLPIQQLDQVIVDQGAFLSLNVGLKRRDGREEEKEKSKEG